MKRYIVVEDLQNGEFGMGRCYTAEEWLQQAVEWRDSDDSWGDYGEGTDCYGNKHLDSRSWFIKFWKRMIKDGKEQELIDYIAEIWSLEFDTKENVVANLQDQVSKNNIPTYDELKNECERYGLEVYEDILSPMEWNSCDRCGDLWESDRLYWLEGYEWDENDEVERKAEQYIADKWEVGEYWSALCPKCMDEIVNKMKGEKNVASV